MAARHKALRHAVRDMDRSLLSRLIRHSLELPVSFYFRNTPVETLSRIEELQHLRRFLTNAVVFVFVDILFVLMFLALMLNFKSHPVHDHPGLPAPLHRACLHGAADAAEMGPADQG